MNTLFVILVFALVVLARQNHDLKKEVVDFRYKYNREKAAAEEFMKVVDHHGIKLSKRSIRHFNETVAFKTIMRMNGLSVKH